MAENKKSVLLYCDLIHTVEGLSDEEAGKLFKHFLRYVNDLNPCAEDRMTALLFEPIKQQLKRDLRKWEDKCLINKENALKRWNATASDGKRTNANHADIDKDTVKDTVTDKDNDKDILLKKELQEIYKNLSNQQSWLEVTARTLRINLPSKEESINKLLHDLKEFITHIGSTGEHRKSESDIKKHFIYYYKKNVK